MPDQKAIYATQAERYDLLVAREDYRRNIPWALSRIIPLDGADVVELGAGTGRLTRLVAPLAGSIRAFDAAPGMLQIAAEHLRRAGARNWTMAVADHRNLPVADRSADVIIAGWSLCYLFAWREGAWQDDAQRALAEARRVLRPGGVMIVLETLGTGEETPCRVDGLGPYYDWLDGMGFASTWTRTDYRFESLQEARELIRFFFGQEMAARAVSGESMTGKGIFVPECTGVWWMVV